MKLVLPTPPFPPMVRTTRLDVAVDETEESELAVLCTTGSSTMKLRMAGRLLTSYDYVEAVEVPQRCTQTKVFSQAFSAVGLSSP